MGKEEYTTASRGTLKLKGAQDGRIGKPHKHKKKKRPKAENAVDDEQAGAAAGETAEQLKDHASGADETLLEEKKVASEEVDDAADGDVLKQAHEEASSGGIKTEAQLRHEAHRRRKLDERLKRQGIKTHKERVEELNRYLSGLSEHHDMPRIGPG